VEPGGPSEAADAPAADGVNRPLDDGDRGTRVNLLV
jgi:hypothetical protein